MITQNLFLKYACLVFSDTHACKELHKRSHKFALQNFQEVMNTEEFLLLPFQEVICYSTVVWTKLVSERYSRLYKVIL